MTKLRNTERLKNVKTTFHNMPDDVPKEGITYFKEDSKGSFNLLYDHIQGYTVNDSHAFFCVNQSSDESSSSSDDEFDDEMSSDETSSGEVQSEIALGKCN